MIIKLKNYDYGYISIKYELFWQSNVIDYFQMEANEGEAQPTREFVTNGAVSSIVDEIKKFESDIIILDLKEIASADKVFHQFVEMEKTVLLINVSEKLCSIIKSEFGNNNVWEKWYEENALVLSSKAHMLESISKESLIAECSDIYTTKLVETLLSEDIYLDLNKYNESSNVYLSKYINLKKIYAKPDMLNFCLYGLYRYILKHNNEFDSFVCTSNNGAVLATVLGAIFRKKVLYLLNLGPKVIIKEKDLWKKIERHNKYFYVYDVLCLGTELKILNVILNMHRAELVGGIGIGRVLPLERYSQDISYEALVDITKYKSDFKYSITLYDDKGDTNEF